MQHYKELTHRAGRDPHNQGTIYDERDPKGRTLALTYSDEGGTFGDELVRRWNTHAGLVEALKDLRDMVIDMREQTNRGNFTRLSNECINMTSAALLKTRDVLAGEP